MIVYLHGFSSAAVSRKASYLKKIFKTDDFHVPDYKAHQPGHSIQYLRGYIEQRMRLNDRRKMMLMGSSLGGYYAQYLGSTLSYVDRVVLINPALHAQAILAPYIGKHNNMVTGETFEFTQADFEELALFDVVDSAELATTLVLLDEGDDVIDYRFAVQRYQDIGRVIVYQGGSHWFDHLDEALPEILAFYEEMEV